MKDYIFSDLACEIEGKEEGSEIRKTEQGVTRMRLEGERYGVRCGEYVTVSADLANTLLADSYERVCQTVARELKDMMRKALGGELGRSSSVLVVGLGNAELTPDSLGPETARRIFVTGAATSDGARCSVSAIAPGVLGSTGIETVEIVRGVADRIRPDLVVAVDALAARSHARVASVVQLSNVGIAPGSGLGARREILHSESVGVPVLAIGVPTVVRSSSLLADAFLRCGMREGDARLRQVLEEQRSFFVTPKEIDLIIKSASMLLADAIDRACMIVNV